MNLDGLRRFSMEQWEVLCRYLQPTGRKEGCHWLVGSINGEPGSSFDVNLRTGIFGDWASDDKKQCGPINYWRAVRRVRFQNRRARIGHLARLPSRHLWNRHAGRSGLRS